MSEKLLSFFNKLRWPMIAVGALIVAAGFGFRTPQSQFTELRAQDAALGRDVAALRDSIRVIRTEAREADEVLRALGALRCLDGTSQRLLQAAGLDCQTLTRSR